MDHEQVLFRLFGKFCPEGTILYAEGAPGEELYLVQSGAVRLGAGAAARELGPGDILGAEAFGSRVPRAQRAEVIRDSRLILVSDRSIAALARQSPAASRRVFEHLAGLAGEARRDLEGWTVGHLLPRLAPLVREAGGSLLRPAELADRAGVAPEEVDLVLQRLASEGCLVADGGGFRVRDAAAFERVAGELAAGGRAG